MNRGRVTLRFRVVTSWKCKRDGEKLEEVQQYSAKLIKKRRIKNNR